MRRSKVIVVGKLPPPYIGPAVATQIILNSALNKEFELFHLNTKVNESIDDFGKGGMGKFAKNLAIYWQLIRLLRESKAVLILIPISQTTLGFLKDSGFILIASMFRVKILLQLRGSNFKNWIHAASRLSKGYVKYCLNKAKGIIVLGNNLRHLFQDYYLSDQIFVVPNGCDAPIPKRTIESERVQVLYFANFLPSKGIKEILQALAILKSRGLENFDLKAVGAWDNEEYKKQCMEIVRESNLSVEFHLPMTGSEKWKTFANADIFLFTPKGPEGHPWVIVEALAASLPIISTDQGAIVESVIHNKNGIILPNSSPPSIAQELERLLSNKDLREAMKVESRKQYEMNFTEAKMVQKLSQTLKHVIN